MAVSYWLRHCTYPLHFQSVVHEKHCTQYALTLHSPVLLLLLPLLLLLLLLLSTDNRLSTFPPDLFEDLSSLFELHLSKNGLRQIPAGGFAALTSLRSLWLTHNRLTTVPAKSFDTLRTLRILYLNENDLVSIPHGAFDSLCAVEHIYLSGNPRLPTSALAPGALSREKMPKLRKVKLPLHWRGSVSGVWLGLAPSTLLLYE